MRLSFSEALRRGFQFRCPNCGQGRIFRSLFRMRERCDTCGLSYYPESGYYTGAMYLDYALSVLVFLLFYAAGTVVLVNTAHNGGRLVHEFGVHAGLMQATAPAGGTEAGGATNRQTEQER